MLPPSLWQWGTSPNLHNWFFRWRIWQTVCAAAGRSLASALGLLQPQAGLTLAARPRSRWPRSPCECSLVTPQLFWVGIGTSFLGSEYLRYGAIWKGSFCDLWLASRTYFSSSLWLVSWFLTQARDLWCLAWLLVFGCQAACCPRLGLGFQIVALAASCSLALQSHLCFWGFPLRSTVVLLTFLLQPLQKWVLTLVIPTALFCSFLNTSFVQCVTEARMQSGLDAFPGTLA